MTDTRFLCVSCPTTLSLPRNNQCLQGLDLGVRGMRVGGQRKLIVPPELAYGSKVRHPAASIACIASLPWRRVCLPHPAPPTENDLDLLPLLPLLPQGVGEVPGNATLEFDVQLLSIKTDSIGARVKLVEG